MKKFSIKLAKEGKELITKEGKEAKIIYYERDSKNFPLVVIINNKDVEFYNTEGKYYKDKESNKDLYIK